MASSTSKLFSLGYTTCSRQVYISTRRSFFHALQQVCPRTEHQRCWPRHSAFPARPEKGECPPVPPRTASAIPSAIPEPPGPEHSRGTNFLLDLPIRKPLLVFFPSTPLMQKNDAFIGQPSHQQRVRWGCLFEPDATVQKD